jgi:hypothetical protein
MALDRTSGFDMLVQVSENEINNQIATAFLAGALFPSSLSVPVAAGGVAGTANLNFGTPSADLDRPRPRMGLSVPFADSQLQLTAPLPLTLAPLGGTITIVDAIEMVAEGANQLAVMDFNRGAPEVGVAFDTASQAVLAPALAAAGMTLAQAENMMAGIVLARLQADIGRLPLTPPIPVVDDADPTTIFDIDVTTVNDASAADRDCLCFGVRMANDSGGNINGVTTSFIPAGSQSLVMMSNFWLLARVMRPRVASALGRPATDFDTPLRLNRNIPAPGGRGTLTRLEARVEGNRIRVDGRARDSGTGWSAVSNFTFFIDIAISGGALTVTASTPSVDTDVDLEWWVWLVSLGLGALFGGIVGAIVAAVVLAIVEAVAEGIVDNLVAGGIGGALGGIPAIPLGPIGGGITLNAVVLDDLELRCAIVRSLDVPVKSQGTHQSLSGFTVDLDGGGVRSDVRPETDLIWIPGQGIRTQAPCGLTVTGAAYAALSPVAVSRLPLAGSLIPITMIPLSWPPYMPFVPHPEVVFGLRTSEGRYAKASAYRSILAGGTLHLRWLTYDTPVPKLDIAARWSVLARGETTEFIRPDCAFCRSAPVSRCGVFEAWPRLMAFPVDYQWCLCGQVLEAGEGTVASADGPLAYRLDGRRLWIETEMEQSVDCELCVSAIDARGRELFTCIRIAQPGIETVCRPCIPRPWRMALEVLPVEAELAAWRPLFPAAIAAAGPKTAA